MKEALNEADIRYMLKLMAEGKFDEVVIIFRRRLDALNGERMYERPTKE